MIPRWVLAGVTSAAALLGPAEGPALAQGMSKEACIAAHADAQRDRLAQHLTAARAHLRRCADASCPGPLREECAAWHGEVLVALPLVLFDVRDSEGAPVTDATLSDGDLVLASPVGAEAVPLDPGEHRLTLRRPDGSAQSVVVSVRGGQGLVAVAVRFHDADAAGHPAATPAGEGPTGPPPRARVAHGGIRPGARPRPVAVERDHPLPLGFWALAATSVVTLGTGGVFAWQGASAQRTLEETCAPWCTAEQIDGMERRYLVADVAFVVAGVSAIGALVVLLNEAAEARPASSHGRAVHAPSRAALAAWRF